MNSSMKIAKISGVQVSIHPTWFIIFFLITSSFMGELSADFPGRSSAFYLVLGLLASLLFFGSVLFHEMSHSLLARKWGHPVRGITLFVFGGISEIEEEARTPTVEFWVAAIGPFSSFFLALVFFLLYRASSGFSTELSTVLLRLAGINVALGVFNLLPAFPLDGGRILRSMLWRFSGNLRQATRKAAGIGVFFGYLLITIGALIAFIGGMVLNGLWLVFIGWFLMNAAQGTVQQQELLHVLEGLKAEDVMSTKYPRIGQNESLSNLVEKHILPSGNRCFLVGENSDFQGLISIHEIKQVPRERWTQTTVKEAMKPANQVKKVTPEEDVSRILQIMDDQKVNQLPVIDHDHVVGIITRERLLNIIRTRMSLEALSGR